MRSEQSASSRTSRGMYVWRTALALCALGCSSQGSDEASHARGGDSSAVVADPIESGGGAGGSAGGEQGTSASQTGRGGFANPGSEDAGVAGTNAQHVEVRADASPGASRDARPDAPIAEFDSTSDASAIEDAQRPDSSRDSCSEGHLFLVPWDWGYGTLPLPDGGTVLPKVYCGGWPDSITYHVWLFQQDAPPIERTIDCSDGTLDVGPVPAGVYEVAILNDDECNEIGAGAIPVASSVSQVCGPLCDPISLVVEPCAVTNLELQVACVATGCDDSCGGA
jgi:hypothetical protein